jgi:hypothetical protein
MRQPHNQQYRGPRPHSKPRIPPEIPTRVGMPGLTTAAPARGMPTTRAETGDRRYCRGPRTTPPIPPNAPNSRTPHRLGHGSRSYGVAGYRLPPTCALVFPSASGACSSLAVALGRTFQNARIPEMPDFQNRQFPKYRFPKTSPVQKDPGNPAAGPQGRRRTVRAP